MNRTNHEKINRRIRTTKQLFGTNRPEAKAKWHPLPFPKKFSNITAPELFSRDLPFFDWVVRKNIIGSSTVYDGDPNMRMLVASQVNDVADRASRILPPGPYRELKEFVIVLDSDNVFECAVVVRKGKKIKIRKGSRIVCRSKTLNAFLPKNYSKPKVGLTRMSKCIDEMYFNVDAPSPARKVQVFFEFANNFGPRE